MKIGKLHCAVAAVFCFGTGYFLNQDTANNVVSNQGVVRNLEAALVKTARQTEQLRGDAFSGIDSIEQILQLPTVFDRDEAAYSLAGRSQAVELLALLHDAGRVADASVRQRLRGIIVSRLVSLGPSLALEIVADSAYFQQAKLINAIWSEWSRDDFESALAHANSKSGSERKVAALALMAANGYMANPRADRIVAELGIHPDTHIRNQYIIALADEWPMKAIAYLNDDAGDWLVDGLVTTFAYHMARQDVFRALELTEFFSKARTKRNYEQIVLAHAAKENPAAIIERAISNAGEKPRSNELYNASHYLVETDLDAAMDYLQQLPKGDAHRILANQIAGKLAGQDFDEALAWVQGADMIGNAQVLATVLQSQLSIDPERAMSHAVEFSRQGQGELMNQVLSQWTALEPRAALDWLKDSQFESTSMWTGIGTTLAFTDLELAKEFLGKVPKEFSMQWKQSIVQRIASNGSSEETLRWVAQYKNDSDYSELMRSTMQYVSHYDFDSAVSITKAIENTSERDQLYLAISQQASYRNPETALSTAQKISDQGLRARALFTPTSHWFRNKPREAEQWLNKLAAGNLRDVAIVGAASTWSEPNSAQLQLIASISDKEMQRHAWIMNLGHQMSERKPIDYSILQQSNMDDATQQAITSVFEVMQTYYH